MGNVPSRRVSEFNRNLDSSGLYYIPNTIGPNNYLLQDDFIESPNKTYKFELKNGNVQLINKNNEIKWQTNTK